jgi:hypothetical protein
LHTHDMYLLPPTPRSRCSARPQAKEATSATFIFFYFPGGGTFKLPRKFIHLNLKFSCVFFSEWEKRSCHLGVPTAESVSPHLWTRCSKDTLKKLWLRAFAHIFINKLLSSFCLLTGHSAATRRVTQASPTGACCPSSVRPSVRPSVADAKLFSSLPFFAP